MLAAMVAVSTLPNYFSGQWPWSKPLETPAITQLQGLMESPLSVSGWETTLQQSIKISGNRWSLAEYQAPAVSTASPVSNFALLLRPQPWHNQQPEVEWIDIIGAQSWQVSDLQTVQFSAEDTSGQSATVTARYFRGLSDRATFAVLQWYAWPTGGHPAPGRWFWADQRRQWRQRQRMPWVAVSLLLPIEPVGDIRPYKETAIAIGKTIQSRLVKSVFNPT